MVIGVVYAEGCPQCSPSAEMPLGAACLAVVIGYFLCVGYADSFALGIAPSV
jgi:hypothetical protein